jgi:thiol-disulfide isomerase/thioredoxin
MKHILAVAMLALAIGIGVVIAEKAVMAQQDTIRLLLDSRSPPLDGAKGWLNTTPLSADDLRGKVVLVEFWTYSCINWLRVQPYVRAWAEKYKDHGLVVVGVHTPEFGFEKNVDNIKWALKNLDVTYPVAIDSNYEIWRAFDNNYWPALYFIDAEGRIRHRQFGEGAYEQSEAVIQEMLIDAGKSGFDRAPVSITGSGVEAPADWETLGTPETYAGYGRADSFAGKLIRDAAAEYSVPQLLLLNHWALSGRWKAGREAAIMEAAGGRIVHRFRARDLHLIMGPATPGASVRFRVRIDGVPPGAAHGLDIDAEGNGTLKEHRLYQLIRQPGAIKDRQFEIEFLDPGAEAFSFTFG